MKAQGKPTAAVSSPSPSGTTLALPPDLCQREGVCFLDLFEPFSRKGSACRRCGGYPSFARMRPSGKPRDGTATELAARADHSEYFSNAISRASTLSPLPMRALLRPDERLPCPYSNAPQLRHIKTGYRMYDAGHPLGGRTEFSPRGKCPRRVDNKDRYDRSVLSMLANSLTPSYRSVFPPRRALVHHGAAASI